MSQSKFKNLDFEIWSILKSFYAKVVKNYYFILLFLSLFLFLRYFNYINEFRNIFTVTNILLFLVIIFIGDWLIKNSQSKLSYFIISTLFSITAYSNLLVNRLSISEMFTDIDIFQYQYPLTIFQFNQIKAFGDLLPWNPYVGAGLVMEGQTATNYIVRETIFSISPSITLATNLYFYFHIIFTMYVLILFFKKLNFTNFVSVIGSFLFITSNQVITWSPFIHYPAFLLSFAILNLALVSSKSSMVRTSILMATSLYICSSGGHLQNLFYLYIYLFVFIFISRFKIFSLKEVVDLKNNLVSIIVGSFIALYFVLPFIDSVNNVGDRSDFIIPTYLKLEHLQNFFNGRVLDPQNNLIWDYDINLQLFISTAIIFSFLIFKSEKFYLEKFVSVLFVIFCLISFESPLQNLFIQRVPGLSLVSNWQRVGPFLIFCLVIYICCKMEEYLKNNNKKIVFTVVLLSVFLSSFTRINIFYNIEVPFRSSDLHSRYVELKKIGNELSDLQTDNSRILSICNETKNLPMVELSTLFINSEFYWAGLYESFPNKYYIEKISSISSTFPGDSGGRYYTHVKGDSIDFNNLSNLNVEYVIVPKDCDIKSNQLFLVQELDEYFLYQNSKNEPIINLGITNGKYTVPFVVDRISHIEIYIETSQKNTSEYLYFNEIYNHSWSAQVNGQESAVVNNDGFMKVKIKKGENEIIFKFNNKVLSRNLESLGKFLFQN